TAGTRYDQEQAKDGKPVPTSVVTLAVTPEDGERIALASNEGQISLALRNPIDVDPTKTAGIKLAALMHGGAAAPKPAAAPRRSAPAPRPVAAAVPPPAPKPY